MAADPRDVAAVDQVAALLVDLRDGAARHIRLDGKEAAGVWLAERLGNVPVRNLMVLAGMAIVALGEAGPRA